MNKAALAVQASVRGHQSRNATRMHKAAEQATKEDGEVRPVAPKLLSEAEKVSEATQDDQEIQVQVQIDDSDQKGCALS